VPHLVFRVEHWHQFPRRRVTQAAAAVDAPCQCGIISRSQTDSHRHGVPSSLAASVRPTERLRVIAYRIHRPASPTHSVASPAMGYWGTCPPPSISNSFIFSSLWSKSESQLSNYSIVCEISWCRCQQLTALSISTASVTKLLVIEQLLHPALEPAVSAP